ncbi:hypothetical protein C8Q70DRAFT_1077975 [Cubamyces menziesii]|nr:hypothetical protein C8Q70DRAFT_1077975 [Cubamyces menziesii]
MLATAILVAFCAASSAFAIPAASASNQDRCQASIGDNAVADFGPFTLAALNKTLGVTSSQTGEALQLSPSVVNSTGQYRSLATNATYPYVEFPTFRLVDGGLIGVNNASTGLGAQADDVRESYPFSFEVLHTALDPEPVFCAVVGTSPAGSNPTVLAVHGDTEHFSLCSAHAVNEDAGTDVPLDVVVYHPRANNHDLYNFRSCYSIYLQLVPTNATAA